MIYVVDTSALIDAWTRWYSPDLVPSFWDLLDEGASRGDLLVPEPVYIELDAQADDLAKWCRQRSGSLVCPVGPRVQDRVQELADRYPNMSSSGRPSKNFADLFVVAVAMEESGHVVTHEAGTGNPGTPKMPDVCRREGLRAMGMDGMARDLGWRFVREE